MKKDRLPSWSTALSAGCRGFESHRRDFVFKHCAVAQWQSAVNPLTHNFVDHLNRLEARDWRLEVIGCYDEGESTFSRRNVFKRDKLTCQYCGKQPGGEELTIDHVVPRAQGGRSSWTNCVLACVDCNSRKAARTPSEARMKLHKQPVRPNWKPIYAQRMNRIQSWNNIISEAYWNVELET